MAVYDENSVRFEYPENWSLDVDEPSGASGPVITVASPGGGFWSLSVLGAEVDLPTMLRTAVDALTAEYQDVDAEAVTDEIEGRTLIGFDVNFYCLDLTSSAMIRGFETPGAAYLLLCHAEDREFDQIERVFEAMTTSLVRGELAESHGPGPRGL